MREIVHVQAGQCGN
jgi:tubulin beta